MSYVLSTSDPEGIPVFLGQVEWKSHILNHHPEVGNFLSDIEAVIKNPIERHRDPENERVNLHYGLIPEPRRLHPKLAYILAVIKYVDAPERDFKRTGFVSSVYFLKSLKKRGMPL